MLFKSFLSTFLPKVSFQKDDALENKNNLKVTDVRIGISVLLDLNQTSYVSVIANS